MGTHKHLTSSAQPPARKDGTSSAVETGTQVPVSPAPEIETPRLRLRMFALADIDDLARILADPEVVRYLGDGLPVARETSEIVLTSIIANWARLGYGRWAVEHKRDQRLIGYGGFRSLNDMFELVYLLDRPYWGAGLATEIARACLRFGFYERHLDNIMAITKPDNLASQRVLQKAGLRFEKEATYFNIDVVQYTISRAEYERTVGSRQ